MATVARTQTLDVPRPRVRLRISRVIFLVLAVIVTAVALAPFILTVSGSFKTKSEILDWPPSIIPRVFEWQNYVEVWTNSHYFPQWILNSTLLAGFHLLVYLAICSAAGYAFARLRFPGSTVLFLAILGSIMVPGQVLWVPKFLIINQELRHPEHLTRDHDAAEDREEEYGRAGEAQPREGVARSGADREIDQQVEPSEQGAVQDPLREVVRVGPDLDVVLPLEDARDDRRRPVQDLALRLERSRDGQDERRQGHRGDDHREHKEDDARDAEPHPRPGHVESLRAGDGGHLVIRPHVQESTLHERDGEDDDEQDHAERAGITHVEIAEALSPEEIRDGQGRLIGSAVRRDLHLVEELEAADRAEQDHEEDCRAHERDRDLEELANRAGPVEVGRLVDGSRDVLHGREKDEHERRRGRPDVHEHDGRQGRRLVSQPVDAHVDPDEAQRRVDESIRQEEPHEDECRDDARGDARQVPRDAEEPSPRELLVEDRGHHQPDERLRGDHDRGVRCDVP